jgi:hypothetical protein
MIRPLLAVLTLLLLSCDRKVEPWDALTLEGIDGRPVRLGDKPSVFVFLETDCPVSNKAAPEVVRLCAAYPGLVFHVVYPGKAESADAQRRHHHDFAYPCGGLRDPDLRLARAAQIKVVPEAAIFLPGKGLVYHGRIDDRYADVGVERPAPTTRDLEAALKAVAKGETPPPAAGPAVGCPVSE